MLTPSILIAAALAGVTIQVPGDQPTLSAALNNAEADDTIVLAAGTWDIPPGQELDIPVSGMGPTSVLRRTNGEAVVMAQGHDVVLSNLTLDGEGRQALTCEGQSVVVTDVVLTNGGPPDSAPGGGLVSLDGCNAAFTRVTFDPTDISVDGGHLHSIDSNVTVVDATFLQGEGLKGGAAYLEGGVLFLVGGTVQGGTASTAGGGLYLSGVQTSITGTRFEGNTSDGPAGAVAVDGGALVADSVVITGNTASTGAGGIHASSSATVDVLLSSFDTNLSDEAGAIGCDEGTTCTVTDSIFQANTGGSGGAMSLGGEATWHRNTLCDNAAVVPYGSPSTAPFGSGGAVALPDTGPPSPTRVGEANVFVRNSAELGGGAVFSAASDVTIRHATLVGNLSATDGSAVDLTDGTLLLENSAVLGHAAPAALHVGSGTFTTRHDLFAFNVIDATFSLDPTDLFVVDPMVADLGSVGCSRDDYVPQPGSPLIDAGTGPNEPDGTPPDIGATGGTIGVGADSDDDGVPDDIDCAPYDAGYSSKTLIYPDLDGDTWGDAFAYAVGCPGSGDTNRAGDCNDDDPDVHPDAPEIPGNGIDDNCDGFIDTGAFPWFPDDDGDGFGDPYGVVYSDAAPTGMIADGTDCDDTNEHVNPDAEEVCNGIDDDCDLLVDDEDPARTGGTNWYADDDSDGFGDGDAPVTACVQPLGTTSDDTDCDDTEEGVNPDAVEVCNGIDDNCDDLTDDEDADVTGGSDFYVDADGDSFAGTLIQACAAPPGSSTTIDDCDDTRDDVNPGADEVCDPDNVDEDCDGLADDLDPDATGQLDYPVDEDGDGFGVDGGTTFSSCDPPVGAAAEGGDCDDTDAAVNPDAEETWYDGIDQDCDGNDDDQDGDGTDLARDCDDEDSTRHPGALDIPDDGIDQDCDGEDAVFTYRAGGCGCSADAQGAAAGSWWALLSRRR